MADGDGTDEWAEVVEAFVDDYYGSLRGRARTYVVHEHLRAVLPAPPASVVDVGGGAGNQSLPLAVEGHVVTIVDPSPAMLDRARRRRASLPAEVADRVRLVEAGGEEAPEALDERFAAVLNHGVLPYLDDPGPMLAALCALAEPGGVVSMIAKNLDTLAVRPAQQGDWAAALASFDPDHDREVNLLGLETRGDRVDDLAARLARHGVELVDWFGVRLLSDGWVSEEDVGEDEDLLLRVELEASRRDPYRGMSRLFHLVGRRGATP